MASSCRLAVCMLVAVAAPPSGVAIQFAEFVMTPSQFAKCTCIYFPHPRANKCMCTPRLLCRLSFTALNMPSSSIECS
ncbi:hypothetical protein B0H19DRAFT_1116643 [Mycena capillaripes]|nr:hypothetical protein B0H19DRAFT_1116643 [Mycena capillaripes]